MTRDAFDAIYTYEPKEDWLYFDVAAEMVIEEFWGRDADSLLPSFYTTHRNIDWKYEIGSWMYNNDAYLYEDADSVDEIYYNLVQPLVDYIKSLIGE